jgi:hypothetical protein
MKAKTLSFVILTATMSFAAAAGAQDEEPTATDESGPPDYPPPGRPQTEVAPGASQAPMPAPAADVGFGTPGQIAVSDDMQMALLRRSTSIMGMTTDATLVQLRPAFDYFLAPNISIGGQLRIEYASGDDGANTTVTTIGLVPRIGYNVALSPTSSIWPHVGLGYLHTSYDNGAGGGNNFSSYTVTLDVFVPLVFQPVPHFFLGGGPFVETDLVSKLEGADTIKTTNIGLMSTIGGYFGG